MAKSILTSWKFYKKSLVYVRSSLNRKLLNLDNVDMREPFAANSISTYVLLMTGSDSRATAYGLIEISGMNDRSFAAKS